MRIWVEPADPRGAGRIIATVGVLLLTLAIAPQAVAQPEPEAVPAAAEAVQAPPDLRSLFRVLELRDGVLLEPRSGFEGVDTIEVGDGTLAINGETVTPSELRDALGDAAGPVLELFDGGEEARTALFAGDGGDDPPPVPERRSERRRHRSHRDARVVFGSSVTVNENETVREVVVIGGNVKVHGEVRGDAAAVGGSTWVDGVVRGSAISVGGSVNLSPGAVVRGDVVSVGGGINGLDQAEVHGEVVEVAFIPNFGSGWWFDEHTWNWRGSDWLEFSPMSHVFGLAWDVFGLVVLILLAFLAILLAPRAVDRIAGSGGGGALEVGARGSRRADPVHPAALPGGDHPGAVDRTLPFDGKNLQDLRDRVLEGNFRVPFFMSHGTYFCQLFCEAGFHKKQSLCLDLIFED